MRRIALLLLGVLLAFAAAPAAEAQERTLRIRHFDAELRVNPDGTTDVTETLRVAFDGQWNGIFRDLSTQHVTGQGRPERLRVTWHRATDPAGREMEVWEESGDRAGVERLRIRVPGAHDAERTVVIRYTVENAVRFFYADDQAEDDAGDLDELYWNVTGNEWGYPIDSVTARIVLPEGVRASRTAAYTGYGGSTEADATVEERENVVTFASTRGMAPGEGMTVAAGWEPGAILSRPTEAEMAASLAAARRREALRLWPLGLPVLAFVLSLRYWRRHGRDPEDGSVEVRYEPPEGMSPAELGTLIDNSAEMRDVTSTLVDLAVRGHVGIEEETSSHLLGLIKSRDYAFHLRHPEKTAGLEAHEKGFLAALNRLASPSGRSWGEVRAALAAAGGSSAPPAPSSDDGRQTRVVRMDDMKQKFYTSLPGIRNAIYDRLVDRGYYIRRPDKVKAAWIGGGVFAGVAGIGGAIFAAGNGWTWFAPGALGVAAAVSAVVLISFGAVMPARTVPGARAREAALGFREFLERVESERYRRMITSPEMFERYLPHALAFGVAEKWAEAFEGMFQEAPQWYAGGRYDGFRATSFASDIVRMNSVAQSTMASSPSSSGSGSGGGGSSGGGSGGGGGGGW